MSELLQHSISLRLLSQKLTQRGRDAVAGGRAVSRRASDLRRTLKQLRLDAVASRLASADARAAALVPLLP